MRAQGWTLRERYHQNENDQRRDEKRAWQQEPRFHASPHICMRPFFPLNLTEG